MSWKFDAMEELSGATDAANSWARDMGVPETESPAGLKALIYKLWDEAGLRLHRCMDRVQEMSLKVEKLEVDNARLREALNHAPHDSKCASHKQEHIPGLTHYETDRELPCPWYHFRRGKCNCWKSRAASAPKAEYETETAI